MQYVKCIIKNFYYEDKYFPKNYEIILMKISSDGFIGFNHQEALELSTQMCQLTQPFSGIELIPESNWPFDLFDKVRHAQPPPLITFDKRFALSTREPIPMLKYLAIGIFV